MPTQDEYRQFERVMDGGEMHDSIAAESVPSVGVFPPDWEKLFTGENQYRLEGGGLGLTESHLSIGGRVFAEKGGESAYVLRGARGLRNEAVPLGSDALESVWVRSVLFCMLLVLLALFILLRRQYYTYWRSYATARFFSVSSVRTVESMGFSLTACRAVGDSVWAVLSGFVLCKWFLLRWNGLVASEKIPFFVFACMFAALLLAGVRHSVVKVASVLSGKKELSLALWENGQVPMRLMWPLLLVGTMFVVYVIPVFQHYAHVLTLSMVALGVALRIYRVGVAFRWYGYGWMYFFLYLCGVEILLPLLAVRVALVCFR